ncbi:hypothetical protein HY251_15685, partial [bacterium]|nr:hypothetical protein [bacterium]
DEAVEIELRSGEVVSGKLQGFSERAYTVVVDVKPRKIEEALVREVRFLARTAKKTEGPPAKEPPRLPFGIVSHAGKGDWATFEARSTISSDETATELTLQVVEAGEASVTLELHAHGKREEARKSVVRLPRDARVETLGWLVVRVLEEARAPKAPVEAAPAGPVVAREVRLDDRDRTVSGRTFPCKRAFVFELKDQGGARIAEASSWDAAIWLSPEVRAVGLVALSADAVDRRGETRKVELELTGFGSPGQIQFGELPREIADSGVTPEPVSGPPPEVSLVGSPLHAAGEVASVAFTVDGTRCLVASPGSLELRDLESGKLLRSFDRAGNVRAIALTEDGKKAFTCDDAGALVRWDLATGERSAASGVTARAVAVVPDHEHVLVGDAHGECSLWDASTTPMTNRGRESHDHRGPVTALAVSRAGLALTGGTDADIHASTVLRSTDGRVNLLSGHWTRILAVGFSRDSRHAIGASEDEIRFWPSSGGALERLLKLPKKSSTIVLSRDGERALALSPDGSARLLDLVNARGASPLDLSSAPYDRASAAAFFSDRRSFLIGTKNGLVLRFEITDK